MSSSIAKKARRLQAARHWVEKVKKPCTVKARVKAYAKKFGVDRVTAARELYCFGLVPEEEIGKQIRSAKGKALQRAALKRKREQKKRETEEAARMAGYWAEGGSAPKYGIAYIAGFTEGGFPFGLTYEEVEEQEYFDAFLAANEKEIDAPFAGESESNAWNHEEGDVQEETTEEA